ncbi:General secretion pathway protein A [Saliniradius amylolyticus]|uniref:General secretion pathway protein A n=1 Tax=Saliniradius amylolyticus TaxID=2183582 RepID=A0A2S2E216_9ALTE|nr:XrtA/PEP-CTERM system-associated ATPase [Saliniradius amylolyticus]AWL11678.1 General secretion pathway protein A [Saliniradius amylolyticus]
MYQSFYGLTDKPFHLTPDPNFFYGSSIHNRAMSYLQYGVQSGEGFIVISGDIGTGKTTLANSLIEQIRDDNITVLHMVTTRLEPEDLLRVTASKLGLSHQASSKAVLVEQIEQALTTLYDEGRRALLIVDEAQNLPPESVEELRMLSNFQTQGRPLLQSFLLGQKELRTLLRGPEMEQFRQRIVASLNLTPLNHQETAEYIQYRIDCVSRQPQRIFTDQALDVIFEYSQGVPRKINTLADRALLFGYLSEARIIDADDVKRVLEELTEESLVEGALDAQYPLDEDKAALEFGDNKVEEDLEYLKTSIAEIRDTLEVTLKHKLKLSRYLDNVIKRRLERLKQGNDAP